MQYECNDCGMSVEGFVCGKCKAELVEDIIQVEGNQVKVLQCPHGCGKIKSPQCCGHDMTASDG